MNVSSIHIVLVMVVAVWCLWRAAGCDFQHVNMLMCVWCIQSRRVFIFRPFVCYFDHVCLLNCGIPFSLCPSLSVSFLASRYLTFHPCVYVCNLFPEMSGENMCSFLPSCMCFVFTLAQLKQTRKGNYFECLFPSRPRPP